MESFSFKLKTDTKFGAGAAESTGKFLRELGFKKVSAVIDSGVVKTSAVKNILWSIEDSCALERVFENKVSEPDYDFLDECKKEFSNDLDCLVGIGGGSTLDLTKGIAVLLKNPGKALNYRGFNLVKNPSIPIVAMPTTAGTGSEVTPYAVFTDKKEMRKLGINTEYNIPRLAILDPLLTLSCPKSVTVSSGMDALTHAMESFVAKNATPFSAIFSKEAFALIFNNLARVLDGMENVELRGNLLLGSHYGGIALMNSGAGPAGAMSYPLGVHFNVPHGLAGAVFLAKVAAKNVEKGFVGYAPLYDLINGANKNLSPPEKGKKFSDALNSLAEKLSVPKTLSGFGVSRKNVDFLIEQTFRGLKGAIEQNPVSFTENDAREILMTMTE